MTGRLSLCAVFVLLSLPAEGRAWDDQAPSAGAQAPAESIFGDIQAGTNGDPVLWTEPGRYSQWDMRFGWWAFWQSGSPAKVGEYQDLDSSPFWDVDGFTTSGSQTVGITATGNDNETTTGSLYFYQPSISTVINYDRYLHRRDHDPLDNFADLDPTLANNPGGDDPLVMRQDLNVGDDYAVRVQELKSSFKGIVSKDNLKVRLDVWALRKEGTRQANLTAMCYNRSVTGAALPPDHLGLNGADLGTFTGARCHVLSQAQHIDWTTVEIKPVVEICLFNRFHVEYSRPIRGFSADDEMVSRFYNVTGSLTYNPTTSNNPPDNLSNDQPYATGVVPKNYTDMDQVKISGDLTENTKGYAFLMIGRTLNREIDMTRWFNNMDFRLTNTSLRDVTFTGYGRVFNEAEEMPDLGRVVALELDPVRPGALVPYNNTRTPNFLPTLEEPINYHKTTLGTKATWRPGGCGFDKPGLALVGGWEYGDLERRNAIFESETTPVITLDQSRTITHSIQVGPYYRWSPRLNTYIRYKFQNADQPLIGFKPLTGTFNTLLPEHDQIVEFGGDWFPSECLMLNATVGIENAGHNSPYADFSEQSYPMSFSAWYAVNPQLSLSAGYAVYSNFVAQDITVGDNAATTTVPPVTGLWTYGANTQVVSLGSQYAMTECVRLTTGVEWVRGHNQITDSTLVFPGDVTVANLGTFSEVLNEAIRVRMGIDWTVRPRVVVYGRYELYEFEDDAPAFQSGLAQGILGGVSALF